MRALSGDEILEAIGGYTTSNIRQSITGISIDTRTIKPGDLFVPLVGPNFDGHDFIEEAFAKGAVASFCNKSKKTGFLDKNIICVENTLEALWNLANYYRGLFNIPFTAITGSVGKTTTKDIIARVLETRFKVLKTRGNFNNEIGLPLTLFGLESYHEMGVVEMGMSGFGEIRRLVNIVKPNIAIITNIGISHIEKLGSKQNITKAKLEILEPLKENDLAVLNADSPELLEIKNTVIPCTVYYGINNGDIRAKDIKSYKGKGIEFKVYGDYGNMNFVLPLLGLHNVYNALPAIVVGFESGFSYEEIQEGFLNCKSSHMRLELKKSATGATIIDDAYNASPDSMRAALDILSEVGLGKVKACILGDMFELGTHSVQAHIDIGRYAADKTDVLIAIGENQRNFAQGAILGGLSDEKIFVFESVHDALGKIQKHVANCDVVLVKASRGMHMERIVRDLTRGS